MVLLKFLFDWAIIGVGTIVPCSLKSKRSKNIFEDRPNFFFTHDPFIRYLLIIIFPKFDPLTATGIACVDLGPKCQNLFRFVSD
jgi:hypothetical protein